MKRSDKMWIAGLCAAVVYTLPRWLALPDFSILENLYALTHANWTTLLLQSPAALGGLAGWKCGGLAFVLPGIALANTLLHILGVFALIAACKLVAKRIPATARLLHAALLLVFLVMIVIGGRSTWRAWKFRITDELARLPIQLVELARKAKGGGGEVYANPSTARALAIFAPDLKTSQWAESGAAAGRIDTWRTLDAANSFQVVVLSGKPGEFRPLFEFLQDSPVWILRAIDAHGVLFVRRITSAGGASSLAEAILSPPPGMTSAGRGVWLARQAGYVALAGRFSEARRLFAAAQEAAPQSAPVAALYASFLAERGQFPEAAKEARKALEIEPNFVPALQVLVQCEIAMARPDSAWAMAQRLEKLAPTDPYSLYIAARAANAANITYEEARILEKAVRISLQRGIPSGAFRIYLGQAYARQGFANQALEQWDAALAEGTLSASQEKQVRELRDAIAAAGSKTP